MPFLVFRCIIGWAQARRQYIHAHPLPRSNKVPKVEAGGEGATGGNSTVSLCPGVPKGTGPQRAWWALLSWRGLIPSCAKVPGIQEELEDPLPL